MDQRKIGAFIKEMRKSLGLTQSQLAEKLNISNKAISKWETGGGMPDVSLIAPLCEALNITSEELFEGQKNFSQKSATPILTKKRYDIVAFVVMLIFITLILLSLTSLSKKVGINSVVISTATPSVMVTNNAQVIVPTPVFSPTPVPTLTPTPTPMPTPVPTFVQTPTPKPTPNGEAVLSIDFEKEDDFDKFMVSGGGGEIELVNGKTGKALQFSNATAPWHSFLLTYEDTFVDDGPYLFECDMCFTKLNFLHKSRNDKDLRCIEIYLRGGEQYRYANIATFEFTPVEENEWFHVSVVLDISDKKNNRDEAVSYKDYTLFGFDSIAGVVNSINDDCNTVLVDNILVTHYA